MVALTSLPGSNVVVGADRAGEEALAERAVGHEADPELFARGEDLLFGTSPPQRVLALHRRDGLDGVGASDRRGGCFGQAEVLDLAGVDQLVDRSGDVFDRDVGVDAVLVEQVERVDLEPLEGGFGDLLDVFGSARQADLATVVVEGEPELRGDHDLTAERGEGFADELFVDERAVDLGGVEERDPADRPHRG